VSFDGREAVGEDEEPFSLDGLERFQLEAGLLHDRGEPEQPDEVRQVLGERARRLLREGVLPIGGVGRRLQRELVEELVPAREAWLALRARYPEPATKFALTLAFDGIVLEDWIDHLRTDGETVVWMQQTTSKIMDKQGKQGALRAEKLADAWLSQLAACAAGMAVTGYLVARDAVVEIAALDCEGARARLAEVVALWRANLDAPLPVASRTALAHLADGKPEAVYDGSESSHEGAPPPEGQDPALARLWPDFEALAAQPGWPALAERLYAPLLAWVEESVRAQPFAGEAA
jgi:exodeoxyribonuclease V gamma subunit